MHLFTLDYTESLPIYIYNEPGDSERVTEEREETESCALSTTSVITTYSQLMISDKVSKRWHGKVRVGKNGERIPPQLTWKHMLLNKRKVGMFD